MGHCICGKKEVFAHGPKKKLSNSNKFKKMSDNENSIQPKFGLCCINIGLKVTNVW
jgi:hypothetical protein